jgi:peroxiredoxin
MKHSGFLSLALLLLLIGSCSNSKNNFDLQLQFENAEQKELILYEVNSYEMMPIDTIRMDASGQSHYSGRIEQPRFFVLRDASPGQITIIVHPGDKISITGDLNDLKNTYKISGSLDSELLQKLNAKMDETIDQLTVISKDYEEKLLAPGTDIEVLRSEIRIEFERIADEQRDFTIKFIENNTTSLASLMAVYQQIDQGTFILNREEDFKYYKLVDSVLIKIYPDLDYTKTLNENVKEMIAAIEFKNLKESTLGIGSVAPEIELPNPDGKVIQLSSLRGKYVLLDFWAAWCGPCRHENPYLVDAYEKFHEKGFTIYQVSLDRTREAWLKGIEDDNLGKWFHVSDLQFWNSSVVPVFQIEGIPANFLLDKEGRIIARNLRGETLAAKLAEILN